MKMTIPVALVFLSLHLCLANPLPAEELKIPQPIIGFAHYFQSRDSVPNQKKPSTYSIKLVPSQGGTYGYEIYSQSKLLIRQMNIPGRSGTKGFKTKSDASKVANLVITKLAKGIMPPTVEKVELDKLHIEY